ncbi:LysR family transcriptional regulator [Candidatus Enterococcus ferrettii]|uniref:HTH lysR-type domain-containing protein n=1 Tax=Candidatus Enterococcus ferrettii TaxID=2815324 RepID=A0ABV0EPL1_9ENTE|nr:LysR family transcriptional regulator [Enterococcus sp. 665A]MBO1338891.1 LysR family transcriptional regulator [Enterococcus sp. 665A]
MDNTQIEAFLAIVANGTITKAAEKLYITQPALGKRISMLEKELGFELIKRQRGVRFVELTDKGREFVSIANRYENIWADTEHLRHKIIKKSLRILASDGPHSFTLHEMYKGFAQKFENVSLKINTTTYRDCYVKVQEKKADIAFPGTNLYFKDVLSVPLYDEKMVFVCRKDSDYPVVVDPRELNVADCIYTPYSTEYTTWFNYWFLDHELSFIETHFITQAEDFLCSFKKNIWTIAPASIVSIIIQNPLLTTKAIADEPPLRTIYFVKRIDHSTSEINDFVDFTRKYLAENKNIKLRLQEDVR